jgi:hypothetical protein
MIGSMPNTRSSKKPKLKRARKKPEKVKRVSRAYSRKLRTLPVKASPNAVKRARARKASGQSCVIKTAAQLDKETRAMGFFAPSKGMGRRAAKKLYPADELGSAAVKAARRLNEDGELRAVKNGGARGVHVPPIAHSTELAQRQAQDPLRRDVLLLAAESGLNPRTTYRWLTGEPLNKRKGVYGTTHKTLVEVAARLGIERRGEGPVRGSEEGEDPILRDVRRLADATDFQRRTVRRWLLEEADVQASTARVLTNAAKVLGIELPEGSRVRSALGERREEDTAGHE